LPAAPVWAAPAVGFAVAPAILIGEWDESYEADKIAVSAIASVEYEEFVRALTPFQAGASPLVSRAGTLWKVYARSMAWKQLEPSLTTRRLEAFLECAHAVLKTGSTALATGCSKSALNLVSGGAFGMI
jgi:hypothetical protein